jgi:hypothetical protein
MREPERGLQRLGERAAQQRAAVIPPALVPCDRLNPRRRQLLCQPQPVQYARRVRADLHAGADLAQRRCLLVHLHIEATTKQRQRRRETADPTSHDAD